MANGAFLYTVADSWAYWLHVELLRGRMAKSSRLQERNKALREAALRDGLAALLSSKAQLLRDAEGISLRQREYHSRLRRSRFIGPWRNSMTRCGVLIFTVAT